MTTEKDVVDHIPDANLRTVCEMQGAALARIMRRLGLVGAQFSEIAEQVEKRLDGCEALIDKLRAKRKI